MKFIKNMSKKHIIIFLITICLVAGLIAMVVAVNKNNNINKDNVKVLSVRETKTNKEKNLSTEKKTKDTEETTLEKESETVPEKESVTEKTDDSKETVQIKETESVKENETEHATVSESGTISAREYYEQNSTVVDVVDAKESTSVPTEEEAEKLLRDRGFVDFPITVEYDMNGTYLGDELSEEKADKSGKYPIYETYFVTDNDDLWSVFVINGKIFANPATFNVDADLPAQILYSETEELTSYDEVSGEFYVTIPKESAVILKVIETINAENLNKLTKEEVTG
ncbi:hypothetical protein SAMN02910289_01908 [Lachnospiraceae bacterium RM5]|nr:hypothetical protein SAMN02910289_01908 [Lachnospiraceae bacterium RM5]